MSFSQQPLRKKEMGSTDLIVALITIILVILITIDLFNKDDD